jgi:hypothetical protein
MTEIKAGMGATELLVTDTVAHVVTRVSASGKTIWTRRVETGPAEVQSMKGPFPVTREPGLLDQPFGEEIQWKVRDGVYHYPNRDEHYKYATRNGWQRLSLGQSYRRVDYSM